MVFGASAAHKESCCLPAICDADGAVGADLGVAKNIQLFRHFNIMCIISRFAFAQKNKVMLLGEMP